jgi:tripartite-type tricarboxylate transporter receptor subunit TctC
MRGLADDEKLWKYNKRELFFLSPAGNGFPASGFQVSHEERQTMTCPSKAPVWRRLSVQSARAGRRPAAALLGATLGILAVWQASAEPFPTRPIRIISPFSAGSAPDALARFVAEQLSGQLRHKVNIENRPGGGTVIATRAAAAADPDGYTLLQANAAFVYASALHANPGYDPVKSFAPVATVAGWSHVLVVPATLPVDTIQDLIAYAKANPGRVNIGFPLGSPPQVLAEMLKAGSGAPFGSIPYRQVPQLMSDLLAGRLQGFFGAGSALVSLVREGKLKALLYTGATRSATLPDVPTAIESGLPRLTLSPSDWTGVLVPAGTPGDVIDKLNAAVNATLTSAQVQASIRLQGGEPKITSPSEFAAFLSAEVRKWPPLVEAAGMKLE